MEKPEDFILSCPIPIAQYPNVLLAHGGGGKLMHQLMETMFLPTFSSKQFPQVIPNRHDAAEINLKSSGRIAFTTDSYVVQPLFFPGGDIGAWKLFGGWCNQCRYGLPKPTCIVTGDTKVVDKGKADGLFINTAGIGIVEHSLAIAPRSVKPGDTILLNGLGRHGIAIMATREGLEFESPIESDSAPLASLVLQLLEAGIEIHCLRDLTRGGLSSALNEIAQAAEVTIAIDESCIPVREDVQGACEILGFDPLYVANEGQFVAFVPQSNAQRALEIMRSHPLGATAETIGNVTETTTSGFVTMKSKIGAQRIVYMLSGEQLPRIC